MEIKSKCYMMTSQNLPLKDSCLVRFVLSSFPLVVWKSDGMAGALATILEHEGDERVQNRPPQDVLLWHVDYFELKAINRNFYLSLKEFKLGPGL